MIRNLFIKASLLTGIALVSAPIFLCGTSALAQTSVTSSLGGQVLDRTGAVVPGVKVTILDTDNGVKRVVSVDASGRYSAPLLKPGHYAVNAEGLGLVSDTIKLELIVGQQATANLTMIPAGSKQTVVVSANTGQLIDTQSANLTTSFTEKQFQQLPAPGGDITTIAYTVPGVAVNVGGSYSNFSSDGLPGTSNLFIINGFDDTDPYLNLNNSGSSNLTIGQEEISQAQVVQDGYSAQYGRNAGAIVTYTTKSGSNKFHGLAEWQYNSSGLNANDFFNNLNGVPREKAVSNQYAAQIGGPILKNKLFFFVDTEGLRYILPTASYLNFPNADMQNTILHSVSAGSAQLYSQMFKTVNSAPSYASSIPVVNGPGPLQDGSDLMGCASYAGTPVYGKTNTYFGADSPKGGNTAGRSYESCMNTAYATGTNLNREWFAAGRVDWNVSSKQELFVRITDDQGQQPTFTSLISPVLSDQSTQPDYTGQLNDTYSFTPNLINQLILSGEYYSAIFKPANMQATLAASPTSFIESTDGGTNSFQGIGQSSNGSGIFGAQYGYPSAFPQGRNVTQYQIVDDLSVVKGNHNLKFGLNFKRDDVTDDGPQSNTLGGYYNFGSLADFAGGSLPGTSNSSFNQNFASISAAYMAFYNYGIYAQDEWQSTPNLKLTYGVRVDRTGDPLCNNNCFSYYLGGFPASGVSTATPYNQSISLGHGSAFPAIERFVLQPRFGFAYNVNGAGKTVVRGGVGLFSDDFPGIIVSNLYTNFPTIGNAAVLAGNVSQGQPDSASTYAQASYNAAEQGFADGENYNQIQTALAADNVPFTPPNFAMTAHKFLMPKYWEWSMQIQQAISHTDAVILSYAGNMGYDLLIPNSHVNQYSTTPFQALPTVSPDPRFQQVFAYQNNARSNYNGVSFTYKHIDNRGLTADVTYTYSHALDDMSNGGSGEYYNSGDIYGSQIYPTSQRYLDYSNADYDVRNDLVADFVWSLPYQVQNRILNQAIAGWTLAGKAFWRSGEPFSVTNTNAGNLIQNGSGATTVLAQVLNPDFNHTCNSYSHPCFQKAGIFNGSATQNIWGNVPRNAFYGPHYADMDVSLYKAFNLHYAHLTLGANAYNLLNHVNFASPNNNASQPASLGVIAGDLSAPTSPYGSFQGSAVSGRVLQVLGKVTF